MRVLKTALIISFVILFSIGCSTTETTNQNASRSAPAPNANAAPAASSANANSTLGSQASANTNQPAKTADEKKKDDKAAGTTKPPSKLDAAALFTSNKCATCHGADGKGKIKGARDFTDAAWQKTESDAELAAVIKNGKKPMPPYGDKLSDDEIKALVAYVRSFGKK
ncbi:MAG TPA: cytochrome c [Blastocatellia bacterium]|nr:cytochrome c [Blastocatellia bacterium]